MTGSDACSSQNQADLTKSCRYTKRCGTFENLYTILPRSNTGEIEVLCVLIIVGVQAIYNLCDMTSIGYRFKIFVRLGVT